MINIDVDGYKQGTMELPEVSVNYYRSGGEKPPMIFLHGVADSGLCWKPMADLFKDRFDVVMIDARGHGSSRIKKKGRFRLSDLADDAAGLVKGLGLKKTVVVGHSMGAATAMMLAQKYPDLLSRVVLSDPPLSFGKSSMIDLIRIIWGIKGDVKAAKRNSPDKAIVYARKQNPTWSDKELIPWIESKKDFGVHGGIKFFGKFDFSADYAAILKSITVKTALIYSSHGLVKQSDTEKILSLKKDLKMFFVEDAGHCIRRDQPKRFLDAVNQFLTQE